jgi:hypothetical protein
MPRASIPATRQSAGTPDATPALAAVVSPRSPIGLRTPCTGPNRHDVPQPRSASMMTTHHDVRCSVRHDPDVAHPGCSTQVVSLQQ